MATTKSQTLGARLLAEQKRVDNLPTLLPNAVFLVGGQSITSAEMETAYKQHLATEAQIVALRSQLRSAMVAIRAERTAIAANDAAVKVVAAGTLGENSTGYASLGFTPRTVRKPTLAVRAVAVVKGAATRVARHTLGPRQKEAIHGTVTEPAPASSPAPAPVTPAVVTK